MTNESVVSDQATEIVKKPKTEKKENLKQRAYLNSLSSIIDFAGAQITGFITNPFIVNGLGTAMYGIWQMLGQMTGYTKMADSRASQDLKWTVANKRHVVTDEELRNDTSTALIVILITMPITLILGSIISWYAPFVAKVPEKYYSLIRITSSILFLSLILNRFFDLFEGILSGMNLGYKRMGLRAGIVAFAGAIKIAVILLGFGLIGLSAVQVLVSVIIGCSFYFIVKKHVPWFGFGKVKRSNIKSFGKVSWWFMVFTTVKMVMVNSDKIILGYFVGPVLVAKYALTMFTSSTIQGAAVAVISGITPGICSLLGKGEFDKVSRARKVVMSFIWLMTVSVGVTILMLNKSFIFLWVGKDKYAGNFENLLILLITVQFIFFQLDSSIINIGLNKKKKAALSIGATLVTLLLSVILVRKYEITGLCISMLVGRLVFTFGFPLLLRKQTHSTTPFFAFDFMYPFAISSLLFLVATWVGGMLHVKGWLFLVTYGTLIFLGSGMIFWYLGIKRSDRKEVMGVLTNVKLLKMN